MSPHLTAEARSEYQRQYREANRERLTEQKRLYREAHREELREAERMRRLTNGDEIRARDRARTPQRLADPVHRAKALERNKTPAYRETRNKWFAAWYAENWHRRKAQVASRRARRAGVLGDFTGDEFRALCEAHGYRCAYCREEFPRLHVDHDVPLSRGGSNFIENILPSCVPCNVRKSIRTAAEYRAAKEAP